MKEVIAVIFNSNQLGGAERSLIEQLSLLGQKEKFHFFYPELKFSDDSLKAFMQEKGFSKVWTFPYPHALYSFSRQDQRNYLRLFWAVPFLISYIFRWYRIFYSYQSFYLNGMKASFPIFLWSLFLKPKITVYWHFRDFPSPILKLFLKLYNLSPSGKLMDLKIIANSRAVEASLKSYFPAERITCVYNRSGELRDKQPPTQIKNIGVVAMMAPWKGLHTIILMTSLYEKELKQLGIKRVSFYGKAIYQTAGSHTDYDEDVRKLKKKLKNELVVFEGEKRPQDIFSEVDLLIHASLEGEPFGRVILEAFKSHIPVLSTALGGARELIGDNTYGYTFRPYDYDGLFDLVKQLCLDPKQITQLTQSAYDHALKIESLAKSHAEGLLIKKQGNYPKSS